MSEHKAETKACCRCKGEFPLNQFYRDETRRDGLYPACIECSRAAARKSYRKRTAHLRTPEAKIAKALKLLKWLEAQKTK
jgi:hypothetical protein